MKRSIKPCLLIFPALVFLMPLTQRVSHAQTAFAEFSVVRQKCSACHKLDAQGRVEVIEESRMTPEEWKVVSDRMIRINGAIITDPEFKSLIKDLSMALCLSPKEMTTIAYLNSDENSQHREIAKDEKEKRLYTTCVRCHTHGKIAAHRMSPAQWGELRKLHLGYYPTVVPQMREMDWAKESKELIDTEIAKLFPFEDQEWRSWMKSRKNPDLSGQWTAAGFQPGVGYYEATYVFKADKESGADEYLIDKEIRYQNGTVLKMNGTGTLYGTYHLRYALSSSLARRTEGVFDLGDDQVFSGKWWNVVQDTNAYGDEMIAKAEGQSRIIAAYPKALKADPGAPQELTLIGVKLPKTVKEADIKFSDPNVKVRKIDKMDSSKIVCKVEVPKNAATGYAKLNIAGVSSGQSIAIFDKMDAIKVLPEIGRARVNCGVAYPQQGVQFVARGISYGKDGKPGTDDDLLLEPVSAKWWLEEEATRKDDDDLKYLKTDITNGLYIPVTTYGPIESRFQHREGTGLIAVGASYAGTGGELKSRALLVVTEPDFIPQIK